MSVGKWRCREHRPVSLEKRLCYSRPHNYLTDDEPRVTITVMKTKRWLHRRCGFGGVFLLLLLLFVCFCLFVFCVCFLRGEGLSLVARFLLQKIVYRMSSTPTNCSERIPTKLHSWNISLSACENHCFLWLRHIKQYLTYLKTERVPDVTQTQQREVTARHSQHT